MSACDGSWYVKPHVAVIYGVDEKEKSHSVKGEEKSWKSGAWQAS